MQARDWRRRCAAHNGVARFRAGKTVGALPHCAEPREYLDGADILASGGPQLLPQAARPLSDIVVVDFSHVIARPWSAAPSLTTAPPSSRSSRTSDR